MEVTADVNPLLRTLILMVIVTAPLMVVILQRLPQIREILNQPKRPEGQTRSGMDMFNFGGRNNVTICPKCFRQNPPDHKFCGFCGAEIPLPKKEQ